jgi:periplasmic protein TonB
VIRRAGHGDALPPPGRVPRPSSAAIASWQRSLVAQLERNKRYPPQAAGGQGTVRLAFRIDRRGRLLTSGIVRSSGSAALDEEDAGARQTRPAVPAPPADVADDQLSFVVPIRYAAMSTGTREGGRCRLAWSQIDWPSRRPRRARVNRGKRGSLA